MAQKTVQEKINDLRIPVVADRDVTIRLTKFAKEQTNCKKGKVYKTDIYNIEFLFKNWFIPFEEAIKKETKKTKTKNKEVEIKDNK